MRSASSSRSAWPPPLYELRIVDGEGRELPPGTDGEIVGRGPVTMPGYYGRPDLTAEILRDGWLYSGDIGFLDGDGFCTSSTGRRI